MTAPIATSQTILVVGGGISGMTTALEAAECGRDVVLVERSPTLGGRTALLYRYFPKMCHPTCGLEINLRRLKASRRVRVLTMTEVVGISGRRGAYQATLKIRPRYVDDRCTACGDCTAAVSATIPNPYNYGMDRLKAAYLPHAMAYPQRYVLDPSIIGTADADLAKAACKIGAIDLEMQEETVQLDVGAVVWATGWRPYAAEKIQPYGYGRFPNVITSVEFERLADPSGPTGGKLLRPSDGKEAKNIAFIQCAGSRDENHLRHCSRICCMATLKQTQYVREALGDAGQSTVYYIDIRSIDRLEDFYRMVQRDATVRFVKSKVARIAQADNGDPILHGVDTEGYHRYATPHDLVVLAIGMEPESNGIILPDDLITDACGFIEGSADGGMCGAGSAASPLDVNRSAQSATAAALRAMKVIHQTASEEA
ncbi:CoB--CoM heterodisulfide reductase iron-sulfur subunit A family protein [Candidatus Thiodictyon syntrophicum]|jgi:quinone-modifying oxidoreductase subunit QmoA|uniref:Heterodisulfide reductase subunit A n=1 Tax=Candidatus Thiodictyon syntrophicum TaxID=1166950 RepID=A0A2K8UA17_9GAMM|nr:FAD-dependent oxidoreductase [Candidatus Thiodictyon syntrophicum]AUB82377.1 heterodisulfide reductase subunit A [Candidatus Thiodictyon syntrophicum]